MPDINLNARTVILTPTMDNRAGTLKFRTDLVSLSGDTVRQRELKKLSRTSPINVVFFKDSR